jgi:hypothetical protein
MKPVERPTTLPFFDGHDRGEQINLVTARRGRLWRVDVDRTRKVTPAGELFATEEKIGFICLTGPAPVRLELEDLQRTRSRPGAGIVRAAVEGKGGEEQSGRNVFFHGSCRRSDTRISVGKTKRQARTLQFFDLYCPVPRSNEIAVPLEPGLDKLLGLFEPRRC